MLKKTIHWASTLSSPSPLLPAAAQTVATGVLSAVTAYFGYYEVGIARAIFFASGVMAFGMTIVFLWLRISSILGVFQRMSVAAIAIPNVAVDSQKGQVTS